jgi:hypothetical protein
LVTCYNPLSEPLLASRSSNSFQVNIGSYNCYLEVMDMDTYQTVNVQMRFNLRKSFPLLTTKVRISVGAIVIDHHKMAVLCLLLESGVMISLDGKIALFRSLHHNDLLVLWVLAAYLLAWSCGRIALVYQWFNKCQGLCPSPLLMSNGRLLCNVLF